MLGHPESFSMMGWAKSLFLVLILAGLVVASVLTYLGLVPGVSDIMGTRQPMDLGVRYTKKDLDSLKAAYQKAEDLNLNSAPAPAPAQSEKADSATPKKPSAPVQAKVSNAQLSALLNGKAQKFLPLKDIQARVTPDEVQISGRLNAEALLTLLKGKGIRNELLAEVQGWAPLFDDAPVYGVLTGGVENGQMAVRVSDVSLGGLDLPEGISKFLSSSVIRAKPTAFNHSVIQETQLGDGELTVKGQGLDALMEP